MASNYPLPTSYQVIAKPTRAYSLMLLHMANIRLVTV
jgi:hypothetical protein